MPRKQNTRRRRKNEGSIYRRSNGKWMGQITVGYDRETGKAIRKYYSSDKQGDVVQRLTKTSAEITGKGTNLLSGDLLLKDFMHQWLTGFKAYQVSSRTMQQYFNNERLHIVPELGAVALKDLTQVRVQTFLYKLQSEKHLSSSALSQVRRTLVQMYDYAMVMGVATVNPARGTKLPRYEREIGEEDGKVISIELRHELLQALKKEDVMRPIIITLMFTGMRIGEALALQWKNVDLEAKTISINQSLTRDITFDDEGQTKKTVYKVGAPKTQTSRRTIQIPNIVADSLREWARYMETKKNVEVTPDGFVFCSTRTMKMRTYSGFRASYKHVLERHHLDGEGLNLHRFRHTYASMLLEQGVSPKIVQKLLGHRDISTTLNIYTHVVPEVFSGVVAAVDKASTQLAAGTYAPKTSANFVLQQLQLLEQKLMEDD